MHVKIGVNLILAICCTFDLQLVCRLSIVYNLQVHYATNRQVVVSIPDGVIGIFQWQYFRSHYGPGVDSASNRNEYQVYFLGVKAAGT